MTLRNLLLIVFFLGSLVTLSMRFLIESFIGESKYSLFVGQYWLDEKFYVPLSFVILISSFLAFRVLLKWVNENH